MTAIFKPSLHDVTLQYDGAITDGQGETMYIDGKPITNVILELLSIEASKQFKEAREKSIIGLYMKGPGDIVLLRPGDQVQLPGHKIQLTIRIYKEGKRPWKPDEKKVREIITTMKEKEGRRLGKLVRQIAQCVRDDGNRRPGSLR
jgi:hypothetical protein